MFTSKLTPQQRLNKAVTAILGNKRYLPLASLAMIGTRTVDASKCPTAATNGRDEWYNPDFIDSLSDAELRFLILHELRHKQYRHLITWKHLHDIDHQRANKACDYYINLEIADENKKDRFAVMPNCGLIDEKYRGLDTARIFNLLADDQSTESGSGSGSESGQPSMDDHDWDGAEELTDAEKQDLEREIDQALRQGLMAAQQLGLTDELNIGELLKPQVDWREVLRDFVTDTCAGKDFSTFSRPNRRFLSTGVYMPSTQSERIDELVVAIDTSGSIYNQATTFLSEVAEICATVTPSKIRVIYWGSEVVGDEVYEPHQYADLAKLTNPKFGGGTDVECVTEYMSDNKITPQACVVLTDGEVYRWGNWGSTPVLWCIMNKWSQITPPHGKVVRIKEGDM